MPTPGLLRKCPEGGSVILGYSAEGCIHVGVMKSFGLPLPRLLVSRKQQTEVRGRALSKAKVRRTYGRVPGQADSLCSARLLVQLPWISSPENRKSSASRRGANRGNRSPSEVVVVLRECERERASRRNGGRHRALG